MASIHDNRNLNLLGQHEQKTFSIILKKECEYDQMPDQPHSLQGGSNTRAEIQGSIGQVYVIVFFPQQD
jgi:hypothetical protein